MQTRQSWNAATLRRFWPVLAIAGLLPVAALAVYAAIGAPSLTHAPVAAAPDTDVAERHAHEMVAGGLVGGREAGDLQQAIERLRARLALDPHDAAGWRLLAQSYTYLGRASEAAEASRQAAAIEAGGASTTGQTPLPVTAPAAMPRRSATALDLVARAQLHRRQREFHAANQAFAELARRGEMDADTWADYADSVGAEHGALTQECVTFINNALRLDPRHAKALWLLGTWQTQREDYAAALATWQQLAAVLPPDSPDARFITENIGEARDRMSAAARPGRQP